MKIWFDGGCRPNPGPISTAVFAGDKAHIRHDHAPGDNADAEWLAALDALARAVRLGLTDVILIGDSRMVIDQASGRTPRVPARFAAHLAQFQALAATFTRLRLRHVWRSHNLAGIALERAMAARLASEGIIVAAKEHSLAGLSIRELRDEGLR